MHEMGEGGRLGASEHCMRGGQAWGIRDGGGGKAWGIRAMHERGAGLGHQSTA